jgi:hypothetical protein
MLSSGRATSGEVPYTSRKSWELGGDGESEKTLFQMHHCFVLATR